MEKPWKVICAFIGVFVAGAVFGGFFTLRASNKRVLVEREADPSSRTAVVIAPEPKSPPPVSSGTDTKPATIVQTPAQPPVRSAPSPLDRSIVPAVMNQMTKRLSPTAGQKEKIRPIIARATDDIQRLTREHWQDTTRVTERMYEDIAALLTSEQRAQLENMRQESLERVRRARERQRDEAQAKSAARSSATQTSPPATGRKSGAIEGANRSP